MAIQPNWSEWNGTLAGYWWMMERARADDSAQTWTCDRCNYMNTGPICTHCGHTPATAPPEGK